MREVPRLTRLAPPGPRVSAYGEPLSLIRRLPDTDALRPAPTIPGETGRGLMVQVNQILAAALSVAMLGPMNPRAVAAYQEVPDSELTQAQIDEALRRATAEEEATRNGIRDVLTSEGVRRLAKNAGIDPAYVEKAA